MQEQQTEIEYQIRILDAKPLSMKTQADESKYEELVTNIVEIVEKRNDVEEEMIQINKRLVGITVWQGSLTELLFLK